MSKIGRNAPCPCGSGKKYKKCCLKRDQATQQTANITSSTSGQQPEQGETASRSRSYGKRTGGLPARVFNLESKRRLTKLTDYIAQMWNAAVQVHNSWIKQRGTSLLGELCDWLCVNPKHCKRRDLELLTATVFISDAAESSDVEGFRDAVSHKLSPPVRRFFNVLCHTPLQVWCVHKDDVGRVFEGHLAFGPHVDKICQLDAVLGSGKFLPAGKYAGWPVLFEGGRFLVFARKLDGEELDDLTWLADEFHGGDSDDFWFEIEEDVLASIVSYAEEPAYELPVGAFDKPWLERLDPENVRISVLYSAEKEGGALRVSLAKASRPEAMTSVLERFAKLRCSAIYRWGDPNDPDLERLLPLEHILAHYGVRPDGSIVDESWETDLRQPVAVLGLDRADLAQAEIDPNLPLGAALNWAGDEPDHPSAQRLVEAADAYQREQRWLATFAASEADGGVRARDHGYDSLLHGLLTLFDFALIETPLDSLQLDGQSLSRLRAAYENSNRKTELETIGDLPKCSQDLFALKGVGRVTVKNLADAMLAWARAWRPARAGIDVKARDNAMASNLEAGIDLREGFEELTSLFESFEMPA